MRDPRYVSSTDPRAPAALMSGREQEIMSSTQTIPTYRVSVTAGGHAKSTVMALKAMTAREAAERAYTTAAGHHAFLGGARGVIEATATNLTDPNDTAVFPCGR